MTKFYLLRVPSSSHVIAHTRKPRQRKDGTYTFDERAQFILIYDVDNPEDFTEPVEAEAVTETWLARDQKGPLYLIEGNKPVRNTKLGIFESGDCIEEFYLVKGSYPHVTWENSPRLLDCTFKEIRLKTQSQQ